MLRLLNRLIRDSAGQDLAEYGMALGVIAAGVGAAAVVIAGNVNTLWQTAKNALAVIAG